MTELILTLAKETALHLGAFTWVGLVVVSAVMYFESKESSKGGESK